MQKRTESDDMTIVMKKDQVIYQQGEPSSNMFLLRSGVVGLFLNYGTPQQFELIELSRPGTSLGEMGLLDGEDRNVTAVAMTDCLLVEITPKRFLSFIEANPQETRQIIMDLSRRFKAAIHEVRNEQKIIADCLEALKDAEEARKDTLKERIKRISDYLLGIPKDVPPELYLGINSRFPGSML